MEMKARSEAPATGQDPMFLPAAEREPTFEPVCYPSLADSVLAEVRRAIINGKVPPGERLVETDLAEQFQVSRATIRQALAQLRFEGLIDIRPRRGAVVTRMSHEAARDVCTVRGLLEGWAARSACVLLTEEQLQTMRSMGMRMGECVRLGNVYEVMEIDIELHSLICRCDPNAYLFERWQSLNALHGALLASRLAYYNYDPVGIVERHHDLIDVLATRVPDAAEEAVRSHYIGPFQEDGHYRVAQRASDAGLPRAGDAMKGG
jgi:DNA-binding GntR family transcriptional regulator